MDSGRNLIVGRLVRCGVLRACRYCGAILGTDHHNRWYCSNDGECKRGHERDRRSGRIGRVRELRWLRERYLRVREERLWRLVDNGRRLMRYIGGEGGNGGDCGWFQMRDIEAGGCCDSWVFANGGRVWRELMRKLVATGQVEVRKAGDEMGRRIKGERRFNEYRFIRLDEGFMNG